MSHQICCFRCGESLAALSLPLSRRDQCPACSADLHVCKMCRSFDVRITRQCNEDGAEDVREKERVNFCDWFVPSALAFNSSSKREADDAAAALNALFGDDGER